MGWSQSSSQLATNIRKLPFSEERHVEGMDRDGYIAISWEMPPFFM